MLDAELQIVDSVTIDVSDSATPAASTTFQMEKRGFPRNTCFIVHIEETADDNALDPVRFELDVTVDDETSWHTVAVIELSGNGSVTKKGPYSVPVGPMDFKADVRADTKIGLRVRVVLATTGSTDDFTYSAYLGSGNPFPHFSHLGVYQ